MNLKLNQKQEVEEVVEVAKLKRRTRKSIHLEWTLHSRSPPRTLARTLPSQTNRWPQIFHTKQILKRRYAKTRTMSHVDDAIPRMNFQNSTLFPR